MGLLDRFRRPPEEEHEAVEKHLTSEERYLRLLELRMERLEREAHLFELTLKKNEEGTT